MLALINPEVLTALRIAGTFFLLINILAFIYIFRNRHRFSLLQSVQASDLIRIALLFFMTLFSLIGLLTSLRLKGELEECLAKIEAMSVQARVNDFVALGQLEGRSSRYPRFRWIFPIFYAMTTAGFITLIVYRLVTGEAMR